MTRGLGKLQQAILQYLGQRNATAKQLAVTLQRNNKVGLRHIYGALCTLQRRGLIVKKGVLKMQAVQTYTYKQRSKHARTQTLQYVVWAVNKEATELKA